MGSDEEEEQIVYEYEEEAKDISQLRGRNRRSCEYHEEILGFQGHSAKQWH